MEFYVLKPWEWIRKFAKELLRIKFLRFRTQFVRRLQESKEMQEEKLSTKAKRDEKSLENDLMRNSRKHGNKLEQGLFSRDRILSEEVKLELLEEAPFRPKGFEFMQKIKGYMQGRLPSGPKVICRRLKTERISTIVKRRKTSYAAHLVRADQNSWAYKSLTLSVRGSKFKGRGLNWHKSTTLLMQAAKLNCSDCRDRDRCKELIEECKFR